MMAGPCNGLWILGDHSEVEKTNLILLDSRIKRWGFVEQILRLYKVWCSWLEVIMVYVLWNIKTKYVKLKLIYKSEMELWSSLFWKLLSIPTISQAYILTSTLYSKQWSEQGVRMVRVLSSNSSFSHTMRRMQICCNRTEKNQGVLAPSYLENSSYSVHLQNSLKVGS